MASKPKDQDATQDSQPVESIRSTSDDVRTGYVDRLALAGKAVTYEVVGDLAVFEADIVLGTVDQVAAEPVTADAADADGELVAHGVGISGQNFRWPGAVVPYDIDPAMPDQKRVLDGIAHWEARTHLTFPRRTAANAAMYPDYVRFFDGDGHYSMVGRQGGKQDISIDTGGTVGTVVHELGHAIGLWHEQSRQDRDSFVTIDWTNIQAGKEHNFNQHINDGDDWGGYDYASIMHYPRTAFAKDSSKPTITPKQSGVTIGQRAGASAGDVNAVLSMYPRPANAATLYAGAWRGGSDKYFLWCNVSKNEFLAKWQELSGQGYRLVDLEVDASSGTTHWTGAWRAGTGAHYLWVNASQQSFVQKWQELSAQGLRLQTIETYLVGNQRLWAGVWGPGGDGHYLWMNASRESFLAKWNELSAQGLRLTSLEVYPSGNQVLWAGTWRAGNDGHYLWVDADQAGFVAKWQELAGQGLRLTTFKTYVSGGKRLWAGVWRAGTDPYYFWVGADFQNFTKKWSEVGAQGLRLVALQHYAPSLVTTDVSSDAGSLEDISGTGEGGGGADDLLVALSAIGTGGGETGSMSDAGGGAAAGVGMGGGELAGDSAAATGGGDAGSAASADGMATGGGEMVPVQSR